MHKKGVFSPVYSITQLFRKYTWDFFPFTLNSCGRYDTRLSYVRLNRCKVKLKEMMKIVSIQKDPCGNIKMLV